MLLLLYSGSALKQKTGFIINLREVEDNNNFVHSTKILSKDIFKDGL